MGFQQRNVNAKNLEKRGEVNKLTDQLNDKYEERDELKEEIDQLHSRVTKYREDFQTARPVAAEFKAQINELTNYYEHTDLTKEEEKSVKTQIKKIEYAMTQIDEYKVDYILLQRRQEELKTVMDDIKKLRDKRTHIYDSMVKYEGSEKISDKKKDIEQL